MNINSSMDGLKSLLGVNSTATTAVAPAKTNDTGSTTGGSALNTDRATFSSAGSEVSSTSAEPDVRTDKVASIKAALAAGTYNVPASAVASKVVDSMMATSQ
jgi:negative regulator of flagellin synthesis FlgM